MIKSYKGLMADSTQERIRLGTPQGKIGYKIVKFDIMGHQLGDGGDQEHVVMLWKTDHSGDLATNVTSRPDFSDQTLLGAAFLVNDISSQLNYSTSVIFDTEIFNQDIFVTLRDVAGSESCNYYIELEQVKLNENEALVAIVKNLRAEAP